MTYFPFFLCFSGTKLFSTISCHDHYKENEMSRQSYKYIDAWMIAITWNFIFEIVLTNWCLCIVYLEINNKGWIYSCYIIYMDGTYNNIIWSSSIAVKFGRVQIVRSGQGSCLPHIDSIFQLDRYIGGMTWSLFFY